MLSKELQWALLVQTGAIVETGDKRAIAILYDAMRVPIDCIPDNERWELSDAAHDFVCWQVQCPDGGESYPRPAWLPLQFIPT